MFERYTEKARRVIFFGRYEASQFGSPYIETEHLLLGLLREDKALTNRFLRSHAAVESIRKQIEGHTTVRERTSTSVDLPISNECKRVLAYAAEEAERLGDKHIGTEHLFLGLLREEKCFAAEILLERGISLDSARERTGQLQRDTPATEPRKPTGLMGEFSAYATEIAKDTRQLVGREKELDRLIEVLSLYSRKNPVLVGEDGVGKRTIVHGLAVRVADGPVPLVLDGKQVLALDLPPLRVLDKDRTWLERLDHTLVSVAERGAIFFVNHGHDLPGGVSPVSSMQITDLLQRALVAGQIQCISTGTPSAYAKLVAEQHWLARCFEPIHVAPATEDEALKVLENIKSAYEQFHQVAYTDEALRCAVRYASTLVTKGALPGKAVDVLDEAGASAQVRQDKLPADVMEVMKRIRFIVQRTEASIANHEFEKARFYSGEEKKERLILIELRKKHNLDATGAFTVDRKEIESAVSKIAGIPLETVRQAGGERSASHEGKDSPQS
jgi:ATP-dependent Clp protease ATP-binding subunit ClpC